MKKLILASTSPRRRELLASLGIPFEVVAPRFEEGPTNLQPADEALFFAEQKARSVMGLCPDSFILGSDTLIECEGAKIGKPEDSDQARRILRILSGKTHFVHTALVLLDLEDGSMRRHIETAQVAFRVLSDREIEDYILTGEPLGKAGAYAVQGKGRTLITKIDGDEEAIIGLPLHPLREWLGVY